VSKHEDQLREAFETHEDMAPDAAAVYARVQELSRSYKWRRRGVQAAGGVVVGAGLIAGVINLPAVLPGSPGTNSSAVMPGAVPVAVSPSAAVVDEQTALNAYSDAGYGYDDAERLAKLWGKKGDIVQVKSDAGRKLLAGQKLPFAPTPDTPVTEEPADPVRDARFEAYFGAGYSYDEAVKLAKLWKLPDPGAAKIEGGKRLLAGEKLPVKPTADGVKRALQAKRVDKFFAAGYDVDDAVRLAKLWHKKDAWAAKIEGGKRLLAGQTLPIKP